MGFIRGELRVSNTHLRGVPEQGGGRRDAWQGVHAVLARYGRMSSGIATCFDPPD
jgi:hypothetical protein